MSFCPLKLLQIPFFREKHSILARDRDCQWSEWEEWSKCTKTCGVGGSQERKRDKDDRTGNGKKCPGRYNQRRVCNEIKCTSIKPPSIDSFVDPDTIYEYEYPSKYVTKLLSFYQVTKNSSQFE